MNPVVQGLTFPLRTDSGYGRSGHGPVQDRGGDGGADTPVDSGDAGPTQRQSVAGPLVERVSSSSIARLWYTVGRERGRVLDADKLSNSTWSRQPHSVLRRPGP